MDKVNISWGNFKVSTFHKIREGIAPFICFKLKENISLGLELTFSREMFEEMQLNVKVNLNDYLTDITYEDDMGWLSLIIEKHNCYIKKIDKDLFSIELNVVSENDNLDIIINHNISILGKE